MLVLLQGISRLIARYLSSYCKVSLVLLQGISRLLSSTALYFQGLRGAESILKYLKYIKDDEPKTAKNRCFWLIIISSSSFFSFFVKKTKEKVKTLLYICITNEF